MTELEELQKKIIAIAETVNSFKSESVQLRVAEILLGQIGWKEVGVHDQNPISCRVVHREVFLRAVPGPRMRMHMRRFTRLTNAFSKKIENHCHAIALHFMS